ncbi:Phage tail length tape-measure protein [Moraxella catarrhalis]|uniref:tape measure protein n=1 Tax=Moraxella catarrhalis TaxID=480 RepID=UPI0007E2FFAF|nr:tape measure protein [Moraxella catarrhalis]OAV34954.1 Phage tail length tape-measure protein [Moraxella catarrhalis]
MSNTYRLDIQVNADSANTALGNLKEHFDKIEQSSGKAGVGIDAFSGKADKASKSSKKAGDGAKKFGDDVDGLKRKTDGLKTAFGTLKGVMFTALAVAGVGGIIQTADDMQTLTSQIKIATTSTKDYAHAMSEIERIAMGNMVSLDSVGQLYASNERSLKQLGKSQDEVIKFTENITTAMRVSGGSAESQAAALTQLGQAMASGVLRGDEFNSVAEQAPVIMELMADSLGVTTGKLRDMAKEGKLTSKVVYDALAGASASDKLAEKSKKMSTTISGAMQNIQTQWRLGVDAIMNGEGGLSSVLAGSINSIALGASSFVDSLPAINQAVTDTIAKAKEMGTAFLESDFGQSAIQTAKDAFEQLKSAMQGVVDIAGDVKAFFEKNPELAIALASGAGAAAGAFLLFKGVLIVWTGAAKLATAAGGALAAVMAVLTSPITLVIAAFAVLVAAGVYVYRNWDTIKQKANDAWQSIKETWQGVGEWFGELWDKVKQTFFGWLSQMPKPVQEMVANIGEIFSTIVDVAGAAWDSIANIAKSVWHAITEFVSSAIDKIKPVIKSVLEFFKNAWDGLVSIAKTVWQAVIGVVSHVFDKISGIISTQFEAMKAIFMAGVTIFASIFNAGFEMVKTIFSTAFKVITAVLTGDMQGVKDAIKDGFQKAVDISKKLVGNIVDALKKLGKDLLQVGRDAMQGFINGISEKIDAAVSKAKEMASSVKNAVTGFFDIHSPSRVMKQIGEWVSEGLAIGIAYKAPIATKEAKNLAKSVKGALESELQKTAEEIFLTKQHIKGNPYAQLTKDIAFGKYGKQDTSRLQKLAQEQILQSNILTLTQQLHETRQNLANVGLTSIEIMQRQYDETDKSVRASLDLFEQVKKTSQELIDATNRHEATQEFESTLKDITKQMAIMGSQDPLAEFLYDLQNAEKYAYYTAGQLAVLKDGMIKLQDAKDKLNAKQAFDTLMKDTALANETPAQRLQREYDEKMAVIDKYEQMHSDKLENATNLRQQITERYEQAEKDAKVKNYQEHLTAFAGFLKNTAGEQSKAYRAMFAVSKAYALADVGVKMGKAVADAWADPSAVTIWQKLANVAKVSLGQGHVLSMINAISPKGFATGGYTGNMGVNQVAGVVHGQEYVLNAKATKRIGVGNLERLNRGDGIGGHVNNISVNVTVNSDGSGDVQANHTMGKQLGYAIKLAVQAELQKERRQGGLLYR